MMYDYVNFYNQYLIPTNDFQLQFHQEICKDASSISCPLFDDYVYLCVSLMYHQIIVKMLLLHVLE